MGTCVNVPKQQCTTVPRESCTQVPKEECRSASTFPGRSAPPCPRQSVRMCPVSSAGRSVRTSTGARNVSNKRNEQRLNHKTNQVTRAYTSSLFKFPQLFRTFSSLSPFSFHFTNFTSLFH